MKLTSTLALLLAVLLTEAPAFAQPAPPPPPPPTSSQPPQPYGQPAPRTSQSKEKKGRVEDSVHACRAAVEEGILPGGGVAVIRARKVLDKLVAATADHDTRLGIEIIRRAVSAPIKQIAANAGQDGSVVAQKVEEKKEAAFGYNALTDEYGDMIKMGVLVPAKVERIAVAGGRRIER